MVYDSNSLLKFVSETNRRLTTARRLLEELTRVCKSKEAALDQMTAEPSASATESESTPFRRIVDKFIAELGDDLYKSSVKTDQELMDLLDNVNRSGSKKEQEEEEEDERKKVEENKEQLSVLEPAPQDEKPLKNKRKRRNTAPLVKPSF